MTIRGEVAGLKREDSHSGEWITVTIKLWSFGNIELQLPSHRARGYKLGRVVEVEVSLTGRYVGGSK